MNYNKSIFYSRPTWVEINQTVLKNNILNISKYLSKKTKICAIIKSNAYGHGLEEIGSIVSSSKTVKYLGVTAIEEAVVLRERGIKLPILLFGNVFPYKNIKEIVHYKITPTVSSVSLLREFEKYCMKNNTQVKFHLKIDTGMGRIGILPHSIDKFIEEMKNSRNLCLEGVYTHFSSAFEDRRYTKQQMQLFFDSLKKINSAGIKQRIIHLANSAAMLLYKEVHCDMVRPGLILYGLKPFSDTEKYIKVSPVLSLKSRIVFLKTLPKGKSISYGNTFITKRKTKVATVPVGYADGILRKMSNVGKVLVGGKFCNILGRVTMDMIMVDVTDINKVSVGDEVVLIGFQGKNFISVEDIAQWCQTINYEITTLLSYRIPRIVV